MQLTFNSFTQICSLGLLHHVRKICLKLVREINSNGSKKISDHVTDSIIEFLKMFSIEILLHILFLISCNSSLVQTSLFSFPEESSLI